jgi:transposase
MLGPSKARRLDQPVLASLEALVPPDHVSRHLERALDLAFVRGLVRETSADVGRPSTDPVVFFKLQLILVFEGLRSERQLMRVVADRLSLRWDVGYALDEPLPDHSRLPRIRERDRARRVPAVRRRHHCAVRRGGPDLGRGAVHRLDRRRGEGRT